MEYSEMRVDFLGAARVIDNFIGGVMEPYSYVTVKSPGA